MTRVKQKISFYAGLPAAFLFVLWPCIVHMDEVRTGLSQEPWFPDVEIQGDFFMHIRGVTLIIFAVVLLILLADRRILQRKSVGSWKSLWPLAVYGVLAAVSTVVSVNTEFSLWGLADQNETLWVLLSCLVVCWYFSAWGSREEGLTGLAAVALPGAALQGMIGLSQLAGHDFWNTAVGRSLILLGRDSGQTLEYTFAEEAGKKVYLSFYNPNYAAVYLLLMLPLAAAGICCFQKMWQKMASAVLIGVLLACLFGTGSRAGLIVLFVLAFLGGMLCLRTMKKRLLVLAAGAACLAVWGILGFFLPSRLTLPRIWKSIVPEQRFYKLQDVTPLEDSVEVTFDGEKYYLTLEEEEGKTYFAILDQEGEAYPLDYDTESGHFTLRDQNYSNLEFEAYKNGDTLCIVMYRLDIPWLFQKEPGADAYQYVTLYGKEDIPENAPYAFGKGYERAMSGRVYLWSRTVPLLSDHLLLGSGPNTYALVFPQNDYVTKANLGLDTLMQIISRPHNMYLQTGVQTGVLSLLVLLFFWGRYLVNAVRQPGGKRMRNVTAAGTDHVSAGKGAGGTIVKNMRTGCSWERAILLSVTGFLLMGLANDAVVVTAPLFWALVGTGWGTVSKEH